MDMNTQTNTKMTENLFSLLYDFVEDMNPDMEMCLDFCESQGIYISDSVYDVITDLLWNKENNWWLRKKHLKSSNPVIVLLKVTGLQRQRIGVSTLIFSVGMDK